MAVEDYHRRRASEYEEIYDRNDPARQEELSKIAYAAQAHLKGKSVLEVACGTGFWTHIVSGAANRVVATDISREMLEIAKRKGHKCKVNFAVADAYCPPFRQRTFDGGLANLWFSHISKGRIDVFLNNFSCVLQEESRVFMADNVYTPSVGENLWQSMVMKTRTR